MSEGPSRLYLRIPGGNVYGTWDTLKHVAFGDVKVGTMFSFAVRVETYIGPHTQPEVDVIRFDQTKLNLSIVDAQYTKNNEIPIGVFTPKQQMTLEFANQLRRVLMQRGKLRRCYGYHMESSLSRI